MNRYCFTLRVRTEHLGEYRRHHEAVWPEMQQALRETGWRNYSLFLRPDGLLIGYVESPLDFDELQAAMGARDVNARWQAEMARFFDSSEGTPDTGLQLAPMVFHLDEHRAPE